jgi:hypothetical protein
MGPRHHVACPVRARISQQIAQHAYHEVGLKLIKEHRQLGIVGRRIVLQRIRPIHQTRMRHLTHCPWPYMSQRTLSSSDESPLEPRESRRSAVMATDRLASLTLPRTGCRVSSATEDSVAHARFLPRVWCLPREAHGADRQTGLLGERRQQLPNAVPRNVAARRRVLRWAKSSRMLVCIMSTLTTG